MSRLGPEPRGVVIDRTGKTAFVAVGVANEVVKVDLDSLAVRARVAVGREPRGSPCAGRLDPAGRQRRSQDVSIVSTQSLAVFRTIPIDGDNLRQVTISADGKRGTSLT